MTRTAARLGGILPPPSDSISALRPWSQPCVSPSSPPCRRTPGRSACAFVPGARWSGGPRGRSGRDRRHRGHGRNRRDRRDWRDGGHGGDRRDRPDRCDRCHGSHRCDGRDGTNRLDWADRSDRTDRHYRPHWRPGGGRAVSWTRGDRRGMPAPARPATLRRRPRTRGRPGRPGSPAAAATTRWPRGPTSSSRRSTRLPPPRGAATSASPARSATEDEAGWGSPAGDAGEPQSFSAVTAQKEAHQKALQGRHEPPGGPRAGQAY